MAEIRFQTTAEICTLLDELNYEFDLIRKLTNLTAGVFINEGLEPTEYIVENIPGTLIKICEHMEQLQNAYQDATEGIRKMDRE